MTEREKLKQPGEKLFGDVVHAGLGQDALEHAASTQLGRDIPLRDSVTGVHDMVRDLEVQLNHMISINEAAERDLEDCRYTTVELERERDELRQKLELAERDAHESLELREELRHMAQENSRLVDLLNLSNDKLGVRERNDLEKEALLANLLRERDVLREENDLLEDQLSEVTRHVETLHEADSRWREIVENRERKVNMLQNRLDMVCRERDELTLEVNEARTALGEIKRSIVDTATASLDGHHPESSGNGW